VIISFGTSDADLGEWNVIRAHRPSISRPKPPPTGNRISLAVRVCFTAVNFEE